jgi:hypothetical protein
MAHLNGFKVRGRRQDRPQQGAEAFDAPSPPRLIIMMPDITGSVASCEVFKGSNQLSQHDLSFYIFFKVAVVHALHVPNGACDTSIQLHAARAHVRLMQTLRPAPCHSVRRLRSTVGQAARIQRPH